MADGGGNARGEQPAPIQSGPVVRLQWLRNRAGSGIARSDAGSLLRRPMAAVAAAPSLPGRSGSLRWDDVGDGNYLVRMSLSLLVWRRR